MSTSSSSLRPLSRSAWNTETARHLLYRAGFGVPESAVAFLVEAGPEEAVASLVDYERFEDNGKAADFVVTPSELAELRRQLREYERDDREGRAQLYRNFRRRERVAVQQLKWWWFERMFYTSRPLQEKVALFWHGHFATSTQRVRGSYMNWQINEVFRRHATGNFKALTTAVGQSPAMLIYLDNRLNRRGAPNENWARELMELFTLGIGNYTEHDIREAARAFTGWTFDPGTLEFTFDIRAHDYGVKEFLGRRGLFEGEDIIKIIFEQDAVATFICGKLWQFFVHEKIDEAAVEGLAKTFRDNDYELKPVLRQLFLSQAFYDAAHRGSHIKSPVEYTIHLLDHLRIDMAELATNPAAQRNVARALAAMGQDLFTPPNVKGWEGNREWINSQTMLMRYNVAGLLINGQVELPAPEPDLEETLSEIEQLRREAEAMRRSDAAFRPRALYDELDGKSVGEVVDALEKRFLVAPTTPEQRRKLIRSLGESVEEETRFRRRDYSEVRLRTLTHLVCSLVEYQVC